MFRSPDEVVQAIRELDRLAGVVGLEGHLVIIGGSALLLIYQNERHTKDVDYIVQATELPHAFMQSKEVQELGFEPVQETLFLAHPDYRETLQLVDLNTQFIRVYALDEYNLILSKLKRNLTHDQEDIQQICRTTVIDPYKLIEMYEEARQYHIKPRWADYTFSELLATTFNIEWLVPETD